MRYLKASASSSLSELPIEDALVIVYCSIVNHADLMDDLPKSMNNHLPVCTCTECIGAVPVRMFVGLRAVCHTYPTETVQLVERHCRTHYRGSSLATDNAFHDLIEFYFRAHKNLSRRARYKDHKPA